MIKFCDQVSMQNFYYAEQKKNFIIKINNENFL